MRADQEMLEAGYVPIHTSPTTSIDNSLPGSNWGTNGIDGVYYNPDNGRYVIGEAKANTGGLSLTDGVRQMSAQWISDNNRLNNAIGFELASSITYDPVLVRVVATDNPPTITMQLVATDGRLVDVNSNPMPQWTP